MPTEETDRWARYGEAGRLTGEARARAGEALELLMSAFRGLPAATDGAGRVGKAIGDAGRLVFRLQLLEARLVKAAKGGEG